MNFSSRTSMKGRGNLPLSHLPRRSIAKAGLPRQSAAKAGPHSSGGHAPVSTGALARCKSAFLANKLFQPFASALRFTTARSHARTLQSAATPEPSSLLVSSKVPPSLAADSSARAGGSSKFKVQSLKFGEGSRSHSSRITHHSSLSSGLRITPYL